MTRMANKWISLSRYSMAETEDRGDHVVVMAAIAYIRCRCGWEHRLQYLKGFTDEDLTFQTIAAFQKHSERKDK